MAGPVLARVKRIVVRRRAGRRGRWRPRRRRSVPRRLPGPAAGQDLRARVERQYQVLPLHNGVLLRTRGARVARTIELTDNRIAVDGVEVTGVELRRLLGADADLVLQLSYPIPAQHALFGLARAGRGAGAGAA